MSANDLELGPQQVAAAAPPPALLPNPVPDHLVPGWQLAVNSIAELLEVPVALLMRIVDRDIEIFVSSETPGNPHSPGERAALLDSGMYCELVTRCREELQVADGRLDARWRNNPELKYGLISYFGMPILLPNGRVFGTLCVLDRRPRTFCGAQRNLVGHVRKLIEGQLSIVPLDWGCRTCKPDSVLEQACISHSASSVLEMRVIERTQQLRRSTQLLQAVMDDATDAIFLKDIDGTFLIFNKAAARFLGRPAEEVVGKRTSDVFSLAVAREIRDKELAVLATGVATTVEETIVTNGQVRTFLTTRSPQRDENGQITGLIGIARNISDAKQAEAALRDSEARWQFAVDSAGDGIWDWNITTGKVFYSRQCMANLGYADAEIGDSIKDWTDKVHPADLPATWQSIQDHLQSNTRDFVAEQRMRSRMGSWRWIMTRGKVIERSADNAAVRVIATQTDITSRRLAEEELKRSYAALRQAADALRAARDKAENAERAKGEFLATMSHEIRTPMNAVIGMARLAMSSELPPRQRNYLEKIDTAARSLLNIINDVLDFSKIEAGGLVLEVTDFELDTVFDSLTDVTALPAEQKGLEITYAIADDVPRTLRGDPLRLGQVLINLVSNAVKFTHAGEVLVTVTRTAQQAGRVTLQFSVRDTGIGLEPGQIEGLFRAFSQLGPHISRQYGGTGLGLAISRQLVELMGGRIWAQGEPDVGSSFHFTIEVGMPRNVEAGGEPLQRAPDPRRVLIADDSVNARAVLAKLVAGLGMQVATAESGSAAIATLKSAALARAGFDLALVDLRMPIIDGIETVRRLRAEPDLAGLPIVLLVTTVGQEQILHSAEPLGLAGVLVKPVTRSGLQATIGKLLDPDRGAAESGRRNLAAPARGLRIPAGAQAWLAGRSVLVVDDNELNREVVTDMLLAVQMTVESAADGAQALRKLAVRRYDAVLMDVHMPGMDGMTASRMIRAQDRLAGLPIIAVTAQVLAHHGAALLTAGMNAVLAKPIDEAVLYKTLMEVLGEPAAMASVPATDGSVAPAAAGFSLERLGDDSARLQRLLRDFLLETATAPERLTAFVAANELGQAAALVHFIRGGAFYMQAPALCATAGRFETAARAGDMAAAHTALAQFPGVAAVTT